MRSFCFSLLLLALAACSSTDSAGPTEATSKVAISPAPAGKVLREAAVTHNFSSTEKPDSFRLQLLGDDALTADAHFFITSAAGDTLWSEHFPAKALLKDEPPIAASADRQAYILKRVDTFFQAPHFSAHAIDAKRVFDADYNGSRETWTEIQQLQSPGFEYLLGDENTRTLAYSPKQAKAVAVHSCC
ncbi:hypothetical protein [Hymenobacter sedentarius]|uniref:hypothetical protein n=1 Tax=Hymenobacter sedentarius TaxID=1411621 RepID=UPI000A5C19BC|nr:hypothetical protein [Hymenobacter sedentarius]